MNAKTTAAADKPADATTEAKAETTYYATRDFKDAGTEHQFAKGEEVKASRGSIANYRAAGLVTTDAPDTPAA